ARRRAALFGSSPAAPAAGLVRRHRRRGSPAGTSARRPGGDRRRIRTETEAAGTVRRAGGPRPYGSHGPGPYGGRGRAVVPAPASPAACPVSLLFPVSPGESSPGALAGRAVLRRTAGSSRTGRAGQLFAYSDAICPAKS